MKSKNRYEFQYRLTDGADNFLYIADIRAYSLRQAQYLFRNRYHKHPYCLHLVINWGTWEHPNTPGGKIEYALEKLEQPQ